MYALESAVLTAWYCSRPEVRRLLAFKETDGLRVLLELEPAQDSSETHPIWMANSGEWTRELRWHTNALVWLEQVDDVATENQGLVVVDLAWRDPSADLEKGARSD